MNRALKIVGLFILFASPTFIIAQSLTSAWTTYRDLDAVKIDFTTQRCGEEPNVITEFYFLQLTNKTANPVSISFRLEYYYNNVCSTCNDDKYIYSFDLPANGSIVPDCNTLTSTAGALAVIKRYVNRNFGSPLDRFELSNIVVR